MYIISLEVNKPDVSKIINTLLLIYYGTYYIYFSLIKNVKHASVLAIFPNPAAWIIWKQLPLREL